jgi:hypothetical protein
MFLLPSKRGKYKKRELKDALGSLLFLYALYVMGPGVECRSADPASPGLKVPGRTACKLQETRAEYLNFTHHTGLSTFSIPSSRAV